MRINNNITAINTHRQYSISVENSAKSTEKLSSGYRINRASDDTAGLAISEKMRAQIRGLNMASKNSEDAISLLQTAEGALSETTAVLQRMRELAVQAATDTNDDSIDRAALDAEYQQLLDEVDDIANNTTFNARKLLDGTVGGAGTVSASGLASGISASADYTAVSGTITIATVSDWAAGPVPSATIGGQSVSQGDASVTLATDVTLDISSLDAADWASQNALNTALFGSTSGSASLTVTAGQQGLIIQTGANTGDTMPVSMDDMTADGLSISGTGINTQSTASQTIDVVNDAINTVSAQRGRFGAMQNRLEHKIGNLDASSENLQASESRIRDVDIADEMTQYTKDSIMMQAATSMLAQANQAPQNVLSLLKQTA